MNFFWKAKKDGTWISGVWRKLKNKIDVRGRERPPISQKFSKPLDIVKAIGSSRVEGVECRQFFKWEG